MPYMRKVEVIVTRAEDPSKKIIFTDHKIDFEIHSTVGWPADTANITIYNLALEEVKFLQSKQYGSMFIEIRAGYLEGGVSGGNRDYIDTSKNYKGYRIEITTSLPTIFSGVITNAVGFRRPPEHVTQLFCISKAYDTSTIFKQMTPIQPGTTLSDAITSMCNDYGFNTIARYGINPEVLETKLLKGRTFQDTFLVEFKNLLSEYNLLYTVTTGEIQIFPDTFGDKDAVSRMSVGRGVVELNVNEVIGNPIAGICTYTLSTFLNSSIQPGMVLDVSPLIGNELLVNGVTSINGNDIVLNTDQSVFRWAMEDKYFIMDVVHRGSTHEITFSTLITALIGGNTAMGNKEAAWQQTYAMSGMALES